jgi:hypothetical protein
MYGGERVKASQSRWIHCLETEFIVTNMTIAGQCFGKHVPAAVNRRSNRRTVAGSSVVIKVRAFVSD